jgi:hypothetical protein
MNASQKTTATLDRRVVLSTLWIFAMLNYVYADIYTLVFGPVLQPEVFKELMSGSVGGIQITQGFVLVTAILMETAIAMVLLSRVLDYGANRWANIIAGIFHTGFVSWSLTGSTPNLFYVMFAIIEIVCTLFIAWYAWQWPSPKASPDKAALTRGEA